jgi:alpha-tubulin suppressor-like RCC1 family protein
MASVLMPGMSGRRPAGVRKTCAALAAVSAGALWLPAWASAQSIPIPALNQPPIQSGLAFAWGNNQTGELGQGHKQDSAVPLRIASLARPIAAISSGADGGLALTRGGRVWAWGGNDQGQLGTGYQRSHDAPVRVKSPGGHDRLSSITAVVSANVASAALNARGRVLTWGNNIWGQLGTGTLNGPKHCPTFMSEPPSEREACSKLPVRVGGGFSMARLANGSIWTWGENNSGQLGIGNHTGPSQCTTEETACSLVPVQVKGPEGAGTFSGSVQISAGQLHATALRAP